MKKLVRYIGAVSVVSLVLILKTSVFADKEDLQQGSDIIVVYAADGKITCVEGHRYESGPEGALGGNLTCYSGPEGALGGN
ncbi:MAG: hypothetical protein HY606_07655 [Planctomycetes bacterium]|nr:hypothetical protein [Planctomycetota bacterium]